MENSTRPGSPSGVRHSWLRRLSLGLFDRKHLPGYVPLRWVSVNFLILAVGMGVLVYSANTRIAQLLDQVSASQVTVKQQQATIASQAHDVVRLEQDLNKQVAHPEVQQWGSTMSLTTGAYLSLPLADTFDVDVSYDADMPVHVYVMTLQDYVRFASCGIACVPRGYQDWGSNVSLDHRQFFLAEGCAGYVAVFQAERSGQIRPSVTLRYNPSDKPTGICSS